MDTAMAPPFLMKFLLALCAVAAAAGAAAAAAAKVTGAATARPCPAGYSHINVTDDCFKVYSLSMAYANAESVCVQDGGHLASLHSDQERRELNPILNAASPLIGIKCSTTTMCVWSDGTPMDYENFSNGKPQIEYGNCAHLFSDDDKFYSWDCATPMNTFLCRVPPRDSECSLGYSQVGGYCVAVRTHPRTADDAENDCAVEDSHLASIHDYQTNYQLFDLISSANLSCAGCNVHIGVRYEKSTGYYWTDGTTFVYTAWSTPVFPDTHFGQCGQMLVSDEFGTPGLWSNVPCDTRQPYVCMRAPGPVATYAPIACPRMQYFEDQGTVYSPGFPALIPSKLYCEYLIAAEIGSTLSVTFPVFNIGADSKLSVYDGMTGANPTFVLQGSSFAGSVFNTSQNIMKMVFETSLVTDGEGWEASFISVPPPSISSKSTNCPAMTVFMVLTSPGLPGGYPVNADCWYYLSTIAGKKLSLSFKFIDTKLGKDYIDVYDGPSKKSGALIASLSGTTSQNFLTYKSTGNYLTLNFSSNNVQGGQGWNATVVMI